MKRSVALIGFYGAGKTRIGRQLAIELCLPFSEMQDEMAKMGGLAIQRLHEQFGDVAYRKYENLALSSLAATGGVVATTGGCIQSNYNRRILHENFLTFFIDAPFDEMVQRIHPSRHPTVGAMSRLELYKLYEYSRPVYQQTANHTIAADCSLDILSDRILDLILEDDTQDDP